MEFDTLDVLDDLGDSVSSMTVKYNEKRRNFLNEDKFACLRYAGAVKTDEEIIRAIELGTKSLEFTQLVEWLSKELQAINKMESCVNALTDIEDASSFLIEVSSFLKEIKCPYKSLMNGPISQRLLDVESHRTFLDYLCTELLAARLLYSKTEVRNTMEIQIEASFTALSLQNALKTLNIEIDAANCSDSEAYLVEMENKIREILDSKSVDVSPSILSESLSDQQWESLQALYEDFFDEYTVRRKLLLTRLEVTVQSFKWGVGSKGKETKLINAYLPQRKHLKDEPSTKLSDVIAARESLLSLEKTSSDNVVKNTKSSVNRVLIPAVPSRGGHPKEQRPLMEMSNSKKKSQDGGRGGGQQYGSGNRKGKNKKHHGGKELSEDLNESKKMPKHQDQTVKAKRESDDSTLTGEEIEILLKSQRSVAGLLKWAITLKFERCDDGIRCQVCQSTISYDFSDGEDFTAREDTLPLTFRH